MRIMHVIPGLAARTGGPPFSVVAGALALQRLGNSVTIYTTDAATTARARDARGGITQDEMPPYADELDIRMFPVRAPYRLAYAPALRRALARAIASYEVVHIHSLFLYPQYAAYREAWRAGVPYVVSPHGALDPYLRQRGRLRKFVVDTLWQRRMLQRAAAIHVTSEEERRQIAEAGIRTRAIVVPNAVNLEVFASPPEPSLFRDRFLGGSNAPLVLYHGRLSEKKGLDILIDAFALLRVELPDARLAIVGPDDEALSRPLAEQARRLGVADAVVFTGMLRDARLASALAAADVWAMPSHGENFGIAVVEALAAGLPVVTSPYVNIAGEIANAGAGVIADLTAEAFAQAIAALLREPDQRAALHGRAREFAQWYDWRTMGERLYAFYESVRTPGQSSAATSGASSK